MSSERLSTQQVAQPPSPSALQLRSVIETDAPGSIRILQSRTTRVALTKGGKSDTPKPSQTQRERAFKSVNL